MIKCAKYSITPIFCITFAAANKEMHMRRLLTFLFVVCACALAYAQIGMSSPVKAKVEQKAVNGHDDLVDIVFTFAINEGWHVYGPDNNGGPTPMTITMETLEGAKVQGALKLSPTPATVEDPVFGCTVTYVEHSAKATQRLRLTGGSWKAQGYLRYGACNDQECMPPTNVEFELKGQWTIDRSAQGDASHLKNGQLTMDNEQEAIETEQDSDSIAQVTVLPLEGEQGGGLWTPVIDELKALDLASNTQSRSLLGIFFLGILGGLIALLTPCVWPIIPMTVSFFLKRAKDDKRKGIRDAILYGLSIVVIYVGLGLLVTLIWGPS